MNMTIRLRPEAQQSLALTRQTIQAVEILEYSPEELDAFLRDQATRNPLLRVDPPLEKTPPLGGGARSFATPRKEAWRAAEDFDLLEGIARDAPPLREALLNQLALTRLDPRRRFLASYLVEALDDDGYLRGDLALMADLLGAEAAEMEAALGEVQKLEPSGVGARNLRECLLLQLADQGPLRPELQALLDHLDLLAEGRAERLARRCRVAPEELPRLLAELRRLDPRPGQAFGAAPPQPALPDVLVSLQGEDGLRIELNPELLPRVLVNQAYHAELSKRMTGPEELTYLRDRLQEANLLVRNLHQRAKTTLTIASWIVRSQEDFFRHGARALRALSQKDVAQLAGVHESTVSRAIANRYLLCGRGQFPLKFFFSDKLPSADGGEVAASVIRQRIQSLVKAETAACVLSDDEILARLQSEGILVARRTIAKYRSQLRIPASAARRRRLRLL